MQTPKRKAYDAVVVGAGIVGLSCAWRAAQRGMSVLVVERDRVAAGASGVAAGMLAPVTEAEFREERLLELNLRGAGLWPAFAAELAEHSGADTGFSRDGALVVAADRDDAEELRRLHGFQRSLGLESEWLSGRDCRRLEPGLSPRVPGGIHAPQDGQVDPVAATHALAAAFQREGGEIVTAAARLDVDGDRVTGVSTADWGVGAAEVVAAAGCWSGELAGLPAEAQPPVRPVKGQLLHLRASRRAPVPAGRIVRTPRCYVVPRADGTVVIGATVEDRGFDTRVTADGVYRLLEAAWEVLPDVGELEFAGAMAGLRPGSRDNLPLIGRAALGGLVWATGHHRNGVLLAPLTGDAVAALLAGEEPDGIDAARPERFEAKVAR